MAYEPLTPERLKELALDCGFSHVGPLAADTIRMRPEVRETCAADKCRAYGKNWSCPPACGSLEECEQRIRQYRGGLLLQTTGKMEDSLDYEMMSQIADDHNSRLRVFQEQFRARFAGESFLLLGGGACKVCEACGCPDTPCRFPDKMIVSMEAMGMVVSDVCTANNLPYYYGPNTLTYVGCVLVK